MKTLPAIAFLAALGALLFSSLSLEFSASLLFATGILTILAADYARPKTPLAVFEFAAGGTGGGSAHRSHLRLAV
jgi:hypothetical protein